MTLAHSEHQINGAVLLESRGLAASVHPLTKQLEWLNPGCGGRGAAWRCSPRPLEAASASWLPAAPPRIPTQGCPGDCLTVQLLATAAASRPVTARRRRWVGKVRQAALPFRRGRRGTARGWPGGVLAVLGGPGGGPSLWLQLARWRQWG